MICRASLFLIFLFSLPYQALSQVQAPSRSAFSECLSQNGIVYGPFRDGQSPDAGIYPSDAQIEEDLAFLSQVTKRIRIYGTKGSFLTVTRLAPQFGLTVMQGIHLGPDLADNEIELTTGIALAKAGLVDTLIVGNEVFTQGLLTKEQLLSYLRRVRKEVPGFVQVSTGETWDKWIANPDLALDVDFVVAHFYPFWENLPIEGAAAAALERYDILQRTLNTASPLRNLKIVIGESGWPSAGYPIQPAAIPGPHNQRVLNFSRRRVPVRFPSFCSVSLTKSTNGGKASGKWRCLKIAH
jgi:exo-beta-1,3-glucanase (GH17 family)